jgi:hypothetical protein
MDVRLVWKIFTMIKMKFISDTSRSVSARYHAQANSSELTQTSTFDTTAMVIILTNLAVMRLEIVFFSGVCFLAQVFLLSG